jgi:hypothetical protein
MTAGKSKGLHVVTENVLGHTNGLNRGQKTAGRTVSAVREVKNAVGRVETVD